MGDRIRRLRRDRDWALRDLAARVPKPDGGFKIAEAFEVDPGRLLGPEDVQRRRRSSA